jgi:hypothetical protein
MAADFLENLLSGGVWRIGIGCGEAACSRRPNSAGR